jgi:hypothetical protein
LTWSVEQAFDFYMGLEGKGKGRTMGDCGGLGQEWGASSPQNTYLTLPCARHYDIVRLQNNLVRIKSLVAISTTAWGMNEGSSWKGPQVWDVMPPVQEVQTGGMGPSGIKAASPSSHTKRPQDQPTDEEAAEVATDPVWTYLLQTSPALHPLCLLPLF